MYVHPYTGLAGEQFAIAIDSETRRVAEVAFLPPRQGEECTDRLWRLLDELDPEAQLPRLSVVRGVIETNAQDCRVTNDPPFDPQ